MGQKILTKLTSRKLWVAIAGIASGIGLICAGNHAEGAVAIATSVAAYIVAEGIVDASAVKNAMDIAEAVSNAIAEKKKEDDADDMR